MTRLPALVKGKPPVEAYRMRVFGGTYLGYASSSLEQRLRECADWYQGKGFFKTA